MKLQIDLEATIARILAETSLSREAVLQRIAEKRSDLGGLITEEGAVAIVAKELGIELFEPDAKRKAQMREMLYDIFGAELEDFSIRYEPQRAVVHLKRHVDRPTFDRLKQQWKDSGGVIRQEDEGWIWALELGAEELNE